MDLLDLLDEAENGPKPCPHVFKVGTKGSDRPGWTEDRNPKSPFFGMWVDVNPDCRRPSPGTLRNHQ